ncbi:unnamed protein product [Rotaria magnacalcarata]|uniref:Peptidase C1A papain C-terminal domain-containing protein n=3 Tax=Rotaria magnacalcarata TaxID=392030 RepID=A0A8S2J4B5_9BILA|nr:unnamed protein product [Rotaria magnacalcarata]
MLFNTSKLMKSEDALQLFIATIGPISVAIDASQDSFQFYRSVVYNEPACLSTELDHGVLAVGYDTTSSGDYYIIKSSWGTTWDMEGYIWMSRREFNISPSTVWAKEATTIIGFNIGLPMSSPLVLMGSRGIHISNDNNLYIADQIKNRIALVLEKPTSILSIFLAKPIFSLSSTMPIDVFVTEKYIYILEQNRFHVVKLLKDGTNPVIAAGVTDQRGSHDDLSRITRAFSIFVDSKENLYVSDTTNNRVIRFSSNSSSGMPGLIIAGNGIFGSDASQLAHPYGIFIDETETLYVADSSNHRIQRWSKGASSAVTVAGTGHYGASLSQLNVPRDIMVDSNKYMYIVDHGNRRILRWPPNSEFGECIASCTNNGVLGANDLKGPTSLAFDKYGSLYISDENSNRVQKYEILYSSVQNSIGTPNLTITTNETIFSQTASLTNSLHTAIVAIAMLCWYDSL